MQKLIDVIDGLIRAHEENDEARQDKLLYGILDDVFYDRLSRDAADFIRSSALPLDEDDSLRNQLWNLYSSTLHWHSGFDVNSNVEATSLWLIEHSEWLKPWALNNLGKYYDDSRKRGDAEDRFRDALDIKPNLAETKFNLASLLDADSSNKYSKEVERLYRGSLRDRPDFMDAAKELACFLVRKSRSAEAETYFKQALAIDPNYSSAMTHLGHLYECQGKEIEAESLYRKALAESPKYTRALHYLAKLLDATSRPDEAFEYYIESCLRDPDYSDSRVDEIANKKGSDTLYLAAALYHLQKDKPDAARARTQLVRITFTADFFLTWDSRISELHWVKDAALKLALGEMATLVSKDSRSKLSKFFGSKDRVGPNSVLKVHIAYLEAKIYMKEIDSLEPGAELSASELSLIGAIKGMDISCAANAWGAFPDGWLEDLGAELAKYGSKESLRTQDESDVLGTMMRTIEAINSGMDLSSSSMLMPVLAREQPEGT